MSEKSETPKEVITHLTSIGREGGLSRSHKKLKAVSGNLRKAMAARFPNNPKWNPQVRKGDKRVMSVKTVSGRVLPVCPACNQAITRGKGKMKFDKVSRKTRKHHLGC